MVIWFRLRLRAVTLLTVGWGIPDVLGADIVHARKLRADGHSIYYVPGSSVKGALRTAASRVAPAYGFTSCGEVEPRRIGEAHARMGGPCDVCRLFGWPGGDPGASLVRVSDFELASTPAAVVLARVSLDDRTLTARRGALYMVEHLVPGTEFVGRIGVADGARGLLPLLLLAVAEMRTRGFGRSSIVDARVEDGGALDQLVEPEWRPLLGQLREWLWSGVVAV